MLKDTSVRSHVFQNMTMMRTMLYTPPCQRYGGKGETLCPQASALVGRDTKLTKSANKRLVSTCQMLARKQQD